MRTCAARLLGTTALVGLLAGCGHGLGYRHHAGPIQPAAQDSLAAYDVGDDGSVTCSRERLQVTLTPMPADRLDRQYPDHSRRPSGFRDASPYEVPGNPYTYGDWTPPGANQAPDRFTVFLLKVKNYEYPKVLIEPANIRVVADNGRRYPALSFPALVEYHRVYAIAFAGQSYHAFQERKSLLQRTLYPETEMVFSGQERQGYLVFSPMDRDVADFTVLLQDVVLRFDYRDEPVERVDMPFRFTRELTISPD